MYQKITALIDRVKGDLEQWPTGTVPWFRGESPEDEQFLLPKIAKYMAAEENYLLQTFRRQAGGLHNTPPHKDTDKWLFLAQHYGIPTRPLDWTESLLAAVYFAVNEVASTTPLAQTPTPELSCAKGEPRRPRLFMLSPHALNRLCMGKLGDWLNFPLSFWEEGYSNIALAWEERNPKRGFDLPMAVPAVYQDTRMISQRSCFTVHGRRLEPLKTLLQKSQARVEDYLLEYEIDASACREMVKDLGLLGVTQASLIPDIENLAKDIRWFVDWRKAEQQGQTGPGA